MTSERSELDAARATIARLNRRVQIAEAAINELTNGTGRGKSRPVAAEVWARCTAAHERVAHLTGEAHCDCQWCSGETTATGECGCEFCKHRRANDLMDRFEATQ